MWDCSLFLSLISACLYCYACIYFLGTTWLHILSFIALTRASTVPIARNIHASIHLSWQQVFIFHILLNNTPLICFYSPQSKIQAIEAKLQKMQDRNSSMDLKPVPGSSQLSVVQREARLKQLELINAKNQSRKPYKRWSVTALLPNTRESQSDWMKASDPWSTTIGQNGHLVMLLTWLSCTQF